MLCTAALESILTQQIGNLSPGAALDAAAAVYRDAGVAIA